MGPRSNIRNLFFKERAGKENSRMQREAKIPPLNSQMLKKGSELSKKIESHINFSHWLSVI